MLRTAGPELPPISYITYMPSHYTPSTLLFVKTDHFHSQDDSTQPLEAVLVPYRCKWDQPLILVASKLSRALGWWWRGWLGTAAKPVGGARVCRETVKVA